MKISKTKPINKTVEQIAEEVLKGDNPIGDFMRALDKMIDASNEFGKSLEEISEKLKKYKK